jgi:hypothetical protein
MSLLYDSHGIVLKTTTTSNHVTEEHREISGYLWITERALADDIIGILIICVDVYTRDI